MQHQITAFNACYTQKYLYALQHICLLEMCHFRFILTFILHYLNLIYEETISCTTVMCRQKEIMYYFLQNRYLLLSPPLNKIFSQKHSQIQIKQRTSLNLPLPKLYSLQLPEQLPVLMDPVKDSEWHRA